MRQSFSAWLLKRLGWAIEGTIPAHGRYLIVVGPHTSNWDFPLGILAQWALGMSANFIGKHQLFRWPTGWLFRALGGFPVNRGKQNNLVSTAVDLFATRDNFVLALTPEGTRKPVSRWKTGFYHIARQARVPIYCVGLNFQKRQVIIRPPLMAGENMAEDMNTILDFFRTIPGRYPQPVPRYEE